MRKVIHAVWILGALLWACGGPIADSESAAGFDDGKADGFAGSFEGVSFTVEQAVLTLDLANRAPRDVLDEQCGVGARAAQGIVDARPLGTIAALAKVPHVGTATLWRLRECAPRWVAANAGAPVCGGGGTFDGVPFSPEQECRALDVVNTAGYLQLASLPAYARRVVYDRRPWRSLSDVARTWGVGAETMKALRSIAAEWVIGRSGVKDTVEHLLRVPPATDDGSAPVVTIDRGRVLGRVAGTPCVWLGDAEGAPHLRLQLCGNPREAALSDLFARALESGRVVRVRAAYRQRENGGRYLQGYGTDFLKITDEPLPEG